jgi:hypothetical protein
MSGSTYNDNENTAGIAPLLALSFVTIEKYSLDLFNQIKSLFLK